MATADSSFPFTAKKLDSLKPQAKEYEVGDAGHPGLRLRVSPTGRKVFRWRYKKPGTNKWGVKTLGEYSKSFGISKARSKLDKLKNAHKHALKTGQTESDVTTVSELADAFYERRIRTQRKRPEEALRVIERDIKPAIGKYKLDTITAPTIGAMVLAIVDRGAPTHAGKVLSLTKQMFGFGDSLGYVPHNPAASLKPDNLGVTANTRGRYLTTDEIRQFWLALDQMPRMSESMKCAFRILLLTGVRSGELLKARWENVDLGKAEWTIPVEDQKLTPKQAQMAKAFVIPLPLLAVNLFKTLKQYAGVSPFVMASRKSKLGRYEDKSIGHACRRMLEQKKDGESILPIPHFTPHDLRRTLRTHLAETLDIQPHVAEKCLNHSLGRIEAIYNHATLFEQRREALERWADYVDRTVHGGNVVEMRA